MHDTAYELGREFFKIYCDGRPARILELGSQNINGSLRELAPADSTYIGVDLAKGEGVDIVLQDPYSLPFEDNHFDAVISSSCLEHDQLFWLSFLEMVRVAKSGGFVYLNTPSNGLYHSYPHDNWRFYPDAGLALIAWARRQGQKISLMESFIARRKEVMWNDCVIVLRKGARNRKPLPNGRVVDHFPDSYNVRYQEEAAVQNFTEFSEDMILLDRAKDKIAAKESKLAEAGILMASMQSGFGEFREAVAAAAAEIEYHRNRIEETVRERDEYSAALQQARDEAAVLQRIQDEYSAALQQAREEAAGLRVVLDAAETKTRQHGVLIKAGEAQIAGLRETLGHIGAYAKERDEAIAALRAAYETRGSEIAALTAARDSEIAALTAARGRAEAAAQHHRAVAAENAADVARLREALAERDAAAAEALAERDAAAAEALAERDAAVAELRAAAAELRNELQEVRDRLDASRRVGRELIAAFRTNLAAPSAPAVRRRRGIFRLPRLWRSGIQRNLVEQTA